MKIEKKLTMRMFSVVALYGRVQFAPSKLPKNVGRTQKGLRDVEKRP
jgi:hypothetical protein